MDRVSKFVTASDCNSLETAYMRRIKIVPDLSNAVLRPILIGRIMALKGYEDFGNCAIYLSDNSSIAYFSIMHVDIMFVIKRNCLQDCCVLFWYSKTNFCPRVVNEPKHSVIILSDSLSTLCFVTAFSIISVQFSFSSSKLHEKTLLLNVEILIILIYTY